jgi:integrase/recombinase XerD
MAFKKRVRVIKKIRTAPSVWRFISLARAGGRYVWDKRPGYYFIEWWEGKKRRRQLAGQVPSDVLEAQRRKSNELIGEFLTKNKSQTIPEQTEGTATPIADAVATFMDHVRVHSPDKPKTVQRYRKVLEHFDRITGKRRFIESVTRSDIDDFKTARSREVSQQHKNRPITPRTINYEVSVLRTFFYFLINERGIRIENPCARFKALKDLATKGKRKPPRYSQAELDKILGGGDERDKTIFATLLMTGLREQELYFLKWPDLDLKTNTLRVTAKPLEGFSPKDYEEREIPLPPDLVHLLKKLPDNTEWVFTGNKGRRMTHLLRRLKGIAKTADVRGATLHKFRHTYATRLLETGTDIVTVQHLMGHSDIETTRQYLDPDESLKRKAANRLKL